MKPTVFALYLLSGAVLAASLTGCETISEDACLAGNWEDIGFADGVKGVSRARLSSIGETCAKYGVQPDRTAYINGLEAGLQRYCTPDQGYLDGSNGAVANAECRAKPYDGYLTAHADGLVAYQARQDYAALKSDWTEVETDMLTIETQLDADDLTIEERRALRSRLRNLQAERDDVRDDVRAMEYEFGWPRWNPDLGD